jgi:5-methylcytosine-specific restriction endonuclease McrA
MGSKHLGSGKWKTQRLIVLRRDCYICSYCGEPANEVDHIQPRVLGGTDDLDNLVAACRRCNAMKGKRSEALFLGQSSTPPVFCDPLSPRAASVIPDNPFVTETTPAIN